MSNNPDSKQDFDRCAECYMLVKAGEYHPYAACVLYRQLGQADKVTACLNSVIEYGRSRASVAAVGGDAKAPATPSDAAMRAAEEISDALLSGAITENQIGAIAEIFTRNLAAEKQE